MYACAFLEVAVELNSFSLGRVLPSRGFSCRAKYFAVGYLPDPACDDALDSDPADPEFVAFPPESVEPEPEPEVSREEFNEAVERIDDLEEIVNNLSKVVETFGNQLDALSIEIQNLPDYSKDITEVNNRVDNIYDWVRSFGE